MPTTNEVHAKVEQATRREELWDEGIKSSLAHERGISREGGLLKYDARIYVPRQHALRGEIIAQFHDHVSAGPPRH